MCSSQTLSLLISGQGTDTNCQAVRMLRNVSRDWSSALPHWIVLYDLYINIVCIVCKKVLFWKKKEESPLSAPLDVHVNANQIKPERKSPYAGFACSSQWENPRICNWLTDKSFWHIVIFHDSLIWIITTDKQCPLNPWRMKLFYTWRLEQQHPSV